MLTRSKKERRILRAFALETLACAILDEVEWRNRYVAIVGLKKTPLSEEQRNRLQQITAETEKIRDEAADNLGA